MENCYVQIFDNVFDRLLQLVHYVKFDEQFREFSI